MRKAVFLLSSALLLAGPTNSVAAPANSHAEPGALDVVIAGGRVMDPESGLDAIRNVGLRGGKIVDISELPLRGKLTIDAHGLVVAPGFIDLMNTAKSRATTNFRLTMASPLRWSSKWEPPTSLGGTRNGKATR